MVQQLDVTGGIEEVAALTFTAPVRLAFRAPTRGGPAIGLIRACLASKGRLRFSATSVRTFVDLTPGQPEAPLVALDTIARNDAAGLERLIFSVLPYVDEIVIGVDGRSDKATFEVAQNYADRAFKFDAADIGLTDEEWHPTDVNPRGRIHFAAARNLGRQRVRAPWTFVVDTDEFVHSSVDLRALVAATPETLGTYAPLVMIDGFGARDWQRLARTRYRWQGAQHNSLFIADSALPVDIDTTIVMDLSLRQDAEANARTQQREAAMVALDAARDPGDLNALFHVAKHRIATAPVAEAVRLVEDFRLRAEPNSVIAFQRQWVAIALAYRFYRDGDHPEANRWAVRTLLDGPSIAAFCVLGDIAEDEGDLLRARAWYECACATTDRPQLTWPGVTEIRAGRLAGIRRALIDPTTAPQIEFGVVDSTEEPTVRSSTAEPADR